VTINISDTGAHQYLSMSGANDYRVKLPSTPVRGGLTFYGGHNVIMIGGEIDLPTPCTTDSQECHGVNISRANTDTGTIHIEGVLFHNPDPTHSKYTGDGVDVNTAQGTDVQLENVRVDGIDGCETGAYPSAHADVFQPYGGVHDIRVDGLTGTSDYQGMEIKQGDNGSVIHSAVFRRVNMDGLANPHGCTGSQYLWWLTSTAGGFNCSVYPTTLDRVYNNPSGSFSLNQGTVWPATSPTFGCPVNVQNSVATWPGLSNVTGAITQGLPNGGDFVPASSVGIGYVSPGYA
jgi:hypothetical protein